jgi:hypothetical protein
VGGGDLIFKGYVPERLYSHARSETVRLYGAVTQIDPATIGPIPAPDDAPPPPPEFAP